MPEGTKQTVLIGPRSNDRQPAVVLVLVAGQERRDGYRTWDHMLRELTLSERLRALAEECRASARSLRNVKPRTQMFQLAADYERKARRAEALEAELRGLKDPDASLIPEISETFLKQPSE